MNKNCPECYGKFNPSAENCTKCLYNKSCAYCKATENTVDSRSKLASFEKMADWNAEIADYDHIPGESSERKSGFVGILSRFFRYILALDDYSLGIIGEIIVPSEPDGGAATVSRLGKLHGCSRQAMHRKLLDMIAKHPELALLFREIMFKLPRARRTFLRNRAVRAENGTTA